MEQEQIQEHNLTEIAERMEKSHDLDMYWDYRDTLDEEQVLKIIIKEEGLEEVENEIYENNIDCISEIISDRIDNLNLGLTEEEKEELRYKCEGRFNFNIEGLIRNSQINLRLELLSNEDMIYFDDWENSETIKDFKERFKGHIKVKDLKREFNNLMNDYALITFYFKVRGLNILELRKQVLEGYITLRKGLEFGLFNSWIGGGSVLEIPLLRAITLNLKDWRIKNNREEIIKTLEGKEAGYNQVMIIADNLKKYSIKETYGLGGFQEY